MLTTARAEHGRALREIDALLKEHPGALVTTPAAYPLVLVRLAHALIDAGYLTGHASGLHGCGRITADLRRKTAPGWVCGTCAARDSKGTCARCGQGKRFPDRRPRRRTVRRENTAVLSSASPDSLTNVSKAVAWFSSN